MPRPLPLPRRTGVLAPLGDDLPALARALSHRRLDLAWASAVGGRLARRTRVLGEFEGVLTIAVKDTAWERHLKALAGRLLGRLRGRGGERIARLRFVVRPDALPEQVEAPAPAARRPVPMAYLREVREAGVTRPRLAEAVARAMAAHLDEPGKE